MKHHLVSRSPGPRRMLPARKVGLTLLALIALAATHPDVAQAEEQLSIPQPVIDECTAELADRQDRMSSCLKGGAVAFVLLNLAQQDDFYGEAAEPVIEACRNQNETFKTTWICFENAVEEAMETRSLIGLEAMPDACYAGISDSSTLDRLVDEQRAAETAIFGEPLYVSWGGIYYPFRGCPEPEAAEGGDPTTGSATESSETVASHISPEACLAYAGIDEFLSSRNAEELEAVVAAVTALPANRRIEGLALLGVPEQAITFARDAEPEEAVAMSFIGTALLRRHHPDIYEEHLASPAVPDEISDLGTAMVDGLLSMALEGYEEGCAGTSEG